MRTFLPIISVALKPNKRSVAGLALSITPPVSIVMIAVTAEFNIASILENSVREDIAAWNFVDHQPIIADAITTSSRDRGARMSRPRRADAQR
jgi:hypothetical protein